MFVKLCVIVSNHEMAVCTTHVLYKSSVQSKLSLIRSYVSLGHFIIFMENFWCAIYYY